MGYVQSNRLARAIAGVTAAFAMLALASNAPARDRPGTPDNPMAWNCEPNTRIDSGFICFTFVDTAEENVRFEVEATEDGQPYDMTGHWGCKQIPGDYWMCASAFDVSGTKSRNNRFGVYAFNLKHDTDYCFRARTRTVPDGVVSAQWSAWVCARTGKPPTPPSRYPPQAPVIKIDTTSDTMILSSPKEDAFSFLRVGSETPRGGLPYSYRVGY